MNAKRNEIQSKLPKRLLYSLLGLAFIIIAFLLLLYPVIIERTEKAAIIRIPANATSAMVHDSIAKYYGNGFASKVTRLCKVRGTDFATRHGAYEIPEGSNALTAMRRLTRGGQTPVRITINGFRDIDLLCRRIAAKMEFTEHDLRAALADPAVLEPYGLDYNQAMALFLDDTYEVYWTTSPQELIAKIGRNYSSFWNDINRNKAEALGTTPAEIMTVASITDEETNKLSEKGTIGRLYINRLRKGMRLQADPTVRFALKDYSIRRVTRKHLGVESPYNTYIHKGLPPGPIRTTSRATLDAILDSEPNDYLYMCAKEDFSGTHNFATSFEEHPRNARRYQKALNARGIR